MRYLTATGFGVLTLVAIAVGLGLDKERGEIMRVFEGIMVSS